MAKAIPAAIALYGKAEAFETSRVLCIERYSQFIVSFGNKGTYLSCQISCMFLLLIYAFNVSARSKINLSNAKNAQDI